MDNQLGGSPTIQQQYFPTTEVSEGALFTTVLFYCLLVIALPIITFFAVQSFICEGLLNLTSLQSNIYGAIAAVIVVHVALGLYIYRAYTGVPKKTGKQD